MSFAFFTLFILLFSTLLALIIVLAVVVLMGWRRVSRYLQQRPPQACDQQIQPHLERYQAEPYLEQCLPLMEPSLFAGFAVQACRDVAALVTAAVREAYRRGTRGLSVVPAAVLGLMVEDGD